MKAEQKIVSLERLANLRRIWRAEATSVVAATGCFDLLHLGHTRLLEFAKDFGVLVVGINSDATVKQLKGPTRPRNAQDARAEVLGALACVTAVSIFEERTAAEFLTLLAPDFWVKGDDYTFNTIDPEERQAMKACGGKIIFFPNVKGHSTTNILRAP